MEILRSLLKDRRIEAYEAAGALAPGQHVFCQKICSRIIQSQFCIVLLNNETINTVEKANANAHIEYGLMLGFNKFVVPFQHEQYQLAFNVAGLDTIKYNEQSFKLKAESALDEAIKQTVQSHTPTLPLGEDIGVYLLLHGTLVSQIDNPAERSIFQLGQACGFNLLIDFTGNRYVYFGNFPKLEPSVIVRRINKLLEIVDNRINGADLRVKNGYIPKEQLDAVRELRRTLEVWILAKDSTDRDIVIKSTSECNIKPNVFTVKDVSDEVGKSGMY
jgi:hypothetical protein